MEKYDCTNDVMKHKDWVRHFMDAAILQLVDRKVVHDNSKLELPEKSIFDEWTPKLKELEFGSDEYKSALVKMGEGLKHHYKHNRHHPEHYANGINDMTLIDIIEMVMDWNAASFEKGVEINYTYLAERFGISEQLITIIKNTLIGL